MENLIISVCLCQKSTIRGSKNFRNLTTISGPLHEEEYPSVFDSTHGNGPYNFANDMTHDAWRQTLPYVIDTFKNGIATVEQEVLTAWYRLTSKDNGACSDGDTTGNTASQLQIEFYPTDVVQDKIFYSALLAEVGSVRLRLVVLI